MQEISIKDIFKILKARLLFLIIIPIVVTVIASIYYMLQPNEYSAETKLYVLLNYVDSTQQVRYDTTVSTQFAGDFKELIKTPRVLEETSKEFSGGINLQKDVAFDITAVAGTRVLNVTATSHSPTLSMMAANTISKVFVEYIKELTNVNMNDGNKTNVDAIKIASEAELPVAPSGPARTRNSVLAYFVSLFLLAGVFIAMEMLNTTLRSADEVENVLDLPVLAGVEDYRSSLKDYLEKGGKRGALSLSIPGTSQESIKALATNIQFSFAGKPMNSLMITSTISTEGKSSLSILLSEAFADDGYKVLIVDLDVRKPSIGKYLGIRHKYDLIDYISGNVRFEDLIVKANKENVNFIDSRHKIASPSQILNYATFDKFLDTAQKAYDIVVFDTPPLGLFIDAAVLATKVSGTLMVVGKGLTEREHAKEVVSQLHKANANLIGVALNYTDRHKNSKYYYGKYYARYGMKKDV
jgi:capsular exopolysaccharide synthesis family protein